MLQQRLADQVTGRLRLGCFPSAVASLAIPTMAELTLRHPLLRVELVELESEEASAAPRRGTC